METLKNNIIVFNNNFVLNFMKYKLNRAYLVSDIF